MSVSSDESPTVAKVSRIAIAIRPVFHDSWAAYPVAVTDMDMSAVRALYELNVFAPMCMVQEFIRLLISSGKARIVNIGSVSGIMPVPFSAAYNTSKAALHAFGNTLRVELAPFKYVSLFFSPLRRDN